MSRWKNRAVRRSSRKHSSAFSGQGKGRDLRPKRTSPRRLSRSGEITGTLRQREYCHGIIATGFRLAIAISLIRQEEESLVLKDWSSESSAEKILVELRSGLLEKVVRIQEGVAIKLEGISVERVGAVLDHRIHDSAGVATVFRIDRVGDEVELT